MHRYTQHIIPPTLQLLSVETAVYEEEEQYRYSYSSACESTRVAHIQWKNYSIKEKGFKRISLELLERTASFGCQEEGCSRQGEFQQRTTGNQTGTESTTERQAMTGMVEGYHQRNGK